MHEKGTQSIQWQLYSFQIAELSDYLYWKYECHSAEWSVKTFTVLYHKQVGKQEYIKFVLAVGDMVIILKTCPKYRIRENSVNNRYKQGTVTLTKV